MYPILLAVIETCYITGGYLFKRWDIQNRITSYSNQASNPQITQISNDVTEIKRRLRGGRMAAHRWRMRLK
jgi:hypothetical protein